MTNQAEIYPEIHRILKEKLFHPHLRGKELDDAIESFRSLCPTVPSPSQDELVREINHALKSLKVSNTSFWLKPGQGTAQLTMSATLKLFLDDRDERWVFTTVLSDGLAAKAGIQSGEALLAVDGIPVTSEPQFPLGRSYTVTILGRDGRTTRDLPITIPSATPQHRPPMVQPSPLAPEILEGGIAYLRVSSFPGTIGFDFAKQLKNVVQKFKRQKVKGLVVDLRGNTGGGVSSLRLMSYFTPDRLLVGYSLGRAERDADTKPEQLPAIDRIPRTKLGLYLMHLRFTRFHKGRSLRLVTEGLGSFPFHNNIAIVVDESTKSGPEIVAAFAKENHLATIVGSKTLGQTLGAANFSIGENYGLRIPLVGWYTAQGQTLEGEGVTPDHDMSPTLPGLRAGSDELLNRAISLVA